MKTINYRLEVTTRKGNTTTSKEYAARIHIYDEPVDGEIKSSALSFIQDWAKMEKAYKKACKQDDAQMHITYSLWDDDDNRDFFDYEIIDDDQRFNDLSHLFYDLECKAPRKS